MVSVAGNPVSMNIEVEDMGGEEVDRVLQIFLYPQQEAHEHRY